MSNYFAIVRGVPAIAVGIMTDTDNTGGNAHAWYGDILFRRTEPQRIISSAD